MKEIPVVFTPDNEPYLGRSLLFGFDQIIISTLELNSKIAPITHTIALNGHQKMASQIIPQTLSIILSIRELIRQGYLFSSFILLRSVVERASILLYLNLFPEKIQIWENGWNRKEAPELSKMIDEIQSKWKDGPIIKGKDYTSFMNSLLHGKPDSEYYSIVPMDFGKIGHTSSKSLDRPDLCDNLCADLISWIAIIQAMMRKYFEGGIT